MIAGGVTNMIAVWMLFHPYERRFGIQGAIPKNKARLARSIGRMVGERLLTPADVMEELERAQVRQTLDEKLGEIISGLLETERGSLREILPPAVRDEVERSLTEAAPTIADTVTAYMASTEFEERVLRFVARSRAELDAQPIGRVLTAERREGITARATSWATELATSEELEQGVREYLDRHARDLLGSEQPMIERIPVPLLNAVEGAIESYLPMAVERLGQFLHHPASRERVREALHDVFQRFVEDLRFHERVIARLMVTERTFDRMLDSIERDGVEQVASLLDDPIVRQEISKAIQDAVHGYLRKPISEIVGDAEGERSQAIVRATGDYVLRVLRDERTRSFLIGKLDDVLQRAEGRTWGQLLAPLDDATIADWILEGARSERTCELILEGSAGALRRVLDQPIGRPGRWLPGDAGPRFAKAVSPALWEWGQAQLPGLIERLNIQDMVERKVLGFSTARVEEMIRSVTERELQTIIKIGYGLGAVIGLIAFALARVGIAMGG